MNVRRLVVTETENENLAGRPFGEFQLQFQFLLQVKCDVVLIVSIKAVKNFLLCVHIIRTPSLVSPSSSLSIICSFNSFDTLSDLTSFGTF